VAVIATPAGNFAAFAAKAATTTTAEQRDEAASS
jgi:hypothetical protein